MQASVWGQTLWFTRVQLFLWLYSFFSIEATMQDNKNAYEVSRNKKAECIARFMGLCS
jgi:hypothetical protein